MRRITRDVRLLEVRAPRGVPVGADAENRGLRIVRAAVIACGVFQVQFHGKFPAAAGVVKEGFVSHEQSHVGLAYPPIGHPPVRSAALLVYAPAAHAPSATARPTPTASSPSGSAGPTREPSNP